MTTLHHFRFHVWIKQSAFDLDAAKLSYGNHFYEWSCFQCEQSAEKALKGIMVFCGMKPPKIHKLSILFSIVKRLRKDVVSSHLSLSSLQSFTFVSRYPFILPGDNLTPHDFITESNASECITEAEAILQFARNLIDNHSQP